jgi:hypothetical protein
VLVLPLLDTLRQQNLVATELVELLQANNLAAPAQDDCDYLESAVKSWINVAVRPQPASLVSSHEDTFVLWAQLLPVRCDFQKPDGVITFCEGNDSLLNSDEEACIVWDAHAPDLSELNATCWGEPSSEKCLEEDLEEYFANALNIRVGGIRSIRPRAGYLVPYSDLAEFTDYDVTVVYNENPTVSLT